MSIFFFLMIRRPPRSTLFPYTTLFRSAVVGDEGEAMPNDVSTLSAQKRDQAGKGPSHRLRAKGLIPAVCYGPYDKPLHVSVDPEAIKKAIATPHKYNTVIKLEIEGGESRTVLFK